MGHKIVFKKIRKIQRLLEIKTAKKLIKLREFIQSVTIAHI